MEQGSSLQEMARYSARFDEHYWRIPQTAWFLMLLVMLAAAVGLFSVGPVSWAQKSGAGSIPDLRYERFVRRGGSTELSVSIPSRAADGGNGTASLWVAGDYLDLISIDGITPEPDKTTAADGGIVFDFNVDRDERALEITFLITPDAMGFKDGSLGVLNGERIRFRQFFYP